MSIIKKNGDTDIEVELSINDKNVPLNDFSERIISRTLYGMISALKTAPANESETEKIEIIIKKRRN
ncbi:MAG TPA: hypothetical protein PKK26_05165 [Candidatus Wallbacteria bacterium]|nr:hypothetical protein [Candidatus Wallbacteria bacterium]